MSENENMAQQIAQQVAQHISQQVELAVTAYRQSLDEERQAIAQHARQQAENTANFVSRTFETEIGDIHSSMDSAIAEATKGIESVVSTLTEQVSAMSQRVSELEASAAKSATAEAEAIKAKEQAEEERDNAEKASAFLAMSGDAEIERMTNEVNFRTREKRILAELKAEREAMEVEADRKADAIQSGLQKYYPEFKENLEKIAEQEDE